MNSSSKPTPTHIAVLSYNICFQAMTHNASGSAPVLGAKCTFLPGTKLTTCAKNMAQMIEALPASLNVPSLDFVGFQEASYWYEQTAAAPNTLGKMQCFHSKEGRSDMASYYDGNKYTLVKSFTGDFSRDRPYQILVLKNTFDSSGTIFINAHNPHGYSYDQMRTHYSNAVRGKLSDAEKTYRIIAVGDYNETSWDWNKRDMYSHEWNPFKSEIMKTKISVVGPIISCAEDGKWADANVNAIGMRGGDYIFDSRDPAPIQVPPLYKYDQYMSDHLPIVALLPK